MKYRVLVCDDDVQLAQEWVDAIRKVATSDYEILDAPSGDQVQRAASEVMKRSSAARTGLKRAPQRCLFDGIDVLIIDYDLLHIDEKKAQHTGEGLGRLTRMFADCAVIVVLNQYPGVHFDLRLRGHLESYADTNADADLIATPGFWCDPPWDGFRPWAWQTISQAVENQRAQVAFLQKSRDKPILDALGMRDEDVSRLSDSAFGFIAPNANDYSSLREITFRECTERILKARDEQALIEFDENAAIRLAAARIGKWLKREVLGPQDVLTDVPHLIQRFPFLMGDEVDTAQAWNRAIHDPVTLKKIFDKSYWFEPEFFLSSPAVWRQRVENDESFRKLRSEFDFTSAPDFVFAEDSSRFIERSAATEFRAGFHNPFDRRFLVRIGDLHYAPQRRLAFGS